MKILFLIRESFPTARPDVHTLFNDELPKLGIETDLVTIAEAGKQGPWNAGKLVLQRTNGKASRALGRLKAAFSLFFRNTADIDIIQARDRIFGGSLALLCARLRGIPFIYWMSFHFPDAWLDLARNSGTLGISGSKRIFYWLRGRLALLLLESVVLKFAHHVFVQSAAMKALLVKRGIDAAKITPIPMGVSPNVACGIAANTSSRVPGAAPTLAYIGALERVRRPEIMIDALVLLMTDYPGIRLTLIGDSQEPGDRVWLQEYIRTRGLEHRITITGWLPPQHALARLALADIGLSPIPRTPMFDISSPTKVAEYLALGIPVIASDQPDQQDLLGRTGGGICVPFTPEGFATGIRAMFTELEIYRQEALAARDRVMQLRGYDVLASTVASVYGNVVAKRGIA